MRDKKRKKERERDWAQQQSGSLPRAPLHSVNKQNTGQLNITFPFICRPEERERERGRQMCLQWQHDNVRRMLQKLT